MVVVVLMALGAVFVFSASANVGQELEWRRFYAYPGLRQMVYFLLALATMYGFSCVDYRRHDFSKGWYRSLSPYFLALSVVLLGLVVLQRVHPIFPQFIPEVNQHYRWVKIAAGPVEVSFQPSELAKWCVVFVLAGYCARYGVNDWKRFFFICGVVALTVGLILVEDFGTAALISLLTLLMLVIAGLKLRYVLAPLPFAVGAFAAAILTSEARQNRILAFLHPDRWTSGINYQPSQSLIALGSGGLFGKGLGRGICKYGHLPEDTTDFIFAIIGEEMGFIGTLAVILLFIAFVWLGMLVVVRCQDRFGQILAGGIVLAIAIQAALNIGVVTVVLPTKGMPLPFVSSGGTSILLSAAAVGVLMNIAKHSPKEELPEAIA